MLKDEKPLGLADSEWSLGLSNDNGRKDSMPREDSQCDCSSDLGSSIRADRSCNPAVDVQMISDKEIERRLKIGRSNRGRTPWNKGKNHSQETRERISKRTREALSDPKVKVKMTNYRSHSDQSKAKISLALTKIWQERLKSKRSQEKWFLLWRRMIAEAAKVGSHGQQELEWDSYEKMKAEAISQQLKIQAEKARAKEIARLRAERVAQNREKVAKLGQQNKEREQKTPVKEPLKRKKLGNSRKKNLVSHSLKHNTRLAKFHHIKKQLEDFKSLQIDKVTKTEPVLESWDLEVIKTEIERRKISLAEQIQAVKDRKADFDVFKVQCSGISHVPVEDKVGGT